MSKGIWEKLRQLLTLVPNRSSGNPIVAWYRMPSPSSHPENEHYTDPATLPASDIAGNPYYARDHRRNYPRIAYYDQTLTAGLLKLGSAANPRIADGNAGTQELAAISEDKLTNIIASSSKDVILGEVLEKSGQPPIPPALNKKKWKILSAAQSGMYDFKYPVRTFN